MEISQYFDLLLNVVYLQKIIIPKFNNNHYDVLPL